MTDSPINLRRTHHIKVKNNKNRKVSSSKWLSRHLNDVYVELSKKYGYRSRAAFKLIEIENKFKIFSGKKSALDLGAAPGSWSQVLYKNKNFSKITAVDLLDIIPINGVNIIKGDIFEQTTIDKILSTNEKYDLILSDIAPNTTGHRNTDHLRIMGICENIIYYCPQLLTNSGNIVLKIFQGGEENKLIKEMQKMFQTVKRFKPNATRNESVEIYLIGINYNNE